MENSFFSGNCAYVFQPIGLGIIRHSALLLQRICKRKVDRFEIGNSSDSYRFVRVPDNGWQRCGATVT